MNDDTLSSIADETQRRLVVMNHVGQSLHQTTHNHPTADHRQQDGAD